MKLTIVGLGLIGGSLAIDLRAQGVADEIIGVEENEKHRREARNRGLVDEILPLDEALKGSDLVILAIPVSAIVETLPHVLDRVSDETTVTDMGSTKATICKAVAGHPRRRQYVASHPMAGTEHSGPLAALRGLFAGRTAVICDADDSAARDLRRVDEVYSALGMRKVYMSSDDHDLHTAYISHLSHITSFVLANTVLDEEKSVSTIFDLAGGGFESTVRLAKSSPSMWAPIFEQNRAPIVAALGAYIEQLQAFHEALAQGRTDELRELMAKANEIRRVLGAIGSGRSEAR
jgi:prephenate dehydrogenase